jgi:predicted HTH domain antitoxin
MQHRPDFNEFCLAIAMVIRNLLCHAKLKDMEVILHIPDDVAQRLSAGGGDISQRALEALALEGYRDQTLTLYQASEMLSLSRVETEDFLGQRHVPLSAIGEAGFGP